MTKAAVLVALLALAVTAYAQSYCATGSWQKTVCQTKLGACCCSWNLGPDTKTQCMFNSTCTSQFGGGTCSDDATCWEGVTVPQECDGQDGTTSCCCTFEDSDSNNPARTCTTQGVCDDLQGTCL
eukprot:TRINITY_DN19706_c0_g1_i1.p2 TRINITY_DN19706_c0_g1~~TRINITY_DN19706_c0_g1_i1.p2  ORF type:complete len:125 (+),score=35.18 TRINITY_DN19706_c0_g1_i1:62-436(+)